MPNNPHDKSLEVNLFYNFLKAVRSKCGNGNNIENAINHNQEISPKPVEENKQNKNITIPNNTNSDANGQNILVSLLNNTSNRLVPTNINLPAFHQSQCLPQNAALPAQPIALSLPFLSSPIVCFKIDNNQFNLNSIPILRTQVEEPQILNKTNKSDENDETAKKSSEEVSVRPRNFKCTFEGCLKSYLKSSHLKQHIRSHTGTFFLSENFLVQ